MQDTNKPDYGKTPAPDIEQIRAWLSMQMEIARQRAVLERQELRRIAKEAITRMKQDQQARQQD